MAQQSDRKQRLAPPLMFAFRSAPAARDAKKKVDLRGAAGERVIVGRPTSACLPITVTRDLGADEHDRARVERWLGGTVRCVDM